ncbi:MAG: hypothetical protein HY040_10785 [Planctomycetes bacterium]|nr:hypothetical protein [Planctomycetota bacterium]
MVRRIPATLMLFLLVAAQLRGGDGDIGPKLKPSQSEELKSVAKPAAARRIYILHSGVHTIFSDAWKNLAAETLRDGLRRRGVCEQDIIVLDNPFPTATWRNLLPFDALTMFIESMEPGSKFSHESYLRLHKALEAREVSTKDELIWIGHSAGGQLGLTLATIARSIWRYPDLAKDAQGYNFDMVVTLGTPVGPLFLPPEVKLRHYYSPEDRVVRWVSKYQGLVLYPLGYKTRINRVPTDLQSTGKIRIFGDVEHPAWDIEGRVLDRILGETSADYRPLWHCQVAPPRPGLGLCQLLCHALDLECHISLEDPPRK